MYHFHGGKKRDPSICLKKEKIKAHHITVRTRDFSLQYIPTVERQEENDEALLLAGEAAGEGQQDMADVGLQCDWWPPVFSLFFILAGETSREK